MSDLHSLISAGLMRFSEQRRALAHELEEPINALIALHIDDNYEEKTEFASFFGQILSTGQLALACPKFGMEQRIEVGTPCTLAVGLGTSRNGYFVLRTKSPRLHGKHDSPVLKEDHLPHFKLCEHVVFPPGINLARTCSVVR